MNLNENVLSTNVNFGLPQKSMDGTFVSFQRVHVAHFSLVYNLRRNQINDVDFKTKSLRIDHLKKKYFVWLLSEEKDNVSRC